MVPRDSELLKRAQKVLPGGVNSPVRAFRAVGGGPPVIARAEGATIEAEDGRRWVDFVNSWGPLILGHAHPAILKAVHEAVEEGMSFGATTRKEIELAEAVIALYPGIEQVRFVSSGTEATMSAIRLARGISGREVILKFSGCYHGHADHLLVAAGSGLATFGQPSSAGVPKAFAELTRILPLDDEEALEAFFGREGTRLAAVIIEALPANNGLLPQGQKFLEKLRNLCSASGALLIFDEVISGFRVAPGGCAERYGITPDIATFGKIIGGGMPVGAFASSSEHMRHLAPEGPVYQAGTLSGNPVAMAAGMATLQTLADENAWDRLEELGAYFQKILEPVLESAPYPIRIVREASIFWFSLQDGPAPRSAEAIGEEAARRYAPIFQGLFDRGFFLAPSAYEVGFLSLAHRREQLDDFARALAEVFSEINQGGKGTS